MSHLDLLLLKNMKLFTEKFGEKPSDIDVHIYKSMQINKHGDVRDFFTVVWKGIS